MGMTFCPGCGAPLLLETQRFCATCGFDLESLRGRARGAQAGRDLNEPVTEAPDGAAATPPPGPVAAVAPALSSPPASLSPQPAPLLVSAVAEPEEAPPASAASTTLPESARWHESKLVPAPEVPVGTPPVAPPDLSIAQGASSSRTSINPALLVIGGIVVVAIVVAMLVVNGKSGGSAGISFSPSTVSCSSPVAFTSTVRLPSSVHAGDTVSETLDGQTVTSGALSTGAVQQADGSWTVTNTSSVATMHSLCAAGGSAGGVNVLTPGTHTEQVLDASGKVLAQGSYTVTVGYEGGGGANVTPAPTQIVTSGSFSFFAATEWANPGISVQTGDVLTFTAGGIYGVAGSDPGKTPQSVGCQVQHNGMAVAAPNLSLWSVVGQIGTGGTPFCIGAGSQVTAAASGELYVTINDDGFGDNWGSVTINWQISHQP